MRLRSAKLSSVVIDDAFWNKHIRLVENVIIPYQWDIMNDRVEGAESSHCIDNFRIAAGALQGEFYGAVFQDTDIAKWLEATGNSLATHKNEQLEQLADEVIDLILEAQQEDGYMNTYFIVKDPSQKWKNLCEGHELYTAGHMIEAAIAYYEGTGKRKFLDGVIKLADLICNVFGPEENKIHGYPGHQEIELALMKLGKLTGEKKYMDMAKYFLDIRGVGKNYFLQERESDTYKLIFPEFQNYDLSYSQSHLPVRQQTTAEGHAVRAVYMYSAMADVADEYKDQELLASCAALWDNILLKRMYVTGGIGSSGFLERFTTDYDLPNDCNYAETCASIGMALFGLRMNQITKKSTYMDTVELQLYNNILAGIALDGKSFFYVNPLEVKPDNCMPYTSRAHVKPVRQKWFGVACCPPNIARTLASIGQYIYGVGENELYVNLFVSNQLTQKVGENEITVHVNSQMPWQGKVNISVKGIEKEISLYFRIPQYAENYTISMNGQSVKYDTKDGYAILRLMSNVDVEIRFDMPVEYVRANLNVSSNVGKVAIKKGPVVYCMEEIDNSKNLATYYLDTDSQPEQLDNPVLNCKDLIFNGFRMCSKQEKLYDTMVPVLEKAVLHFVPYAYWNNRGKGEMLVWINAVPK